MRRALAGREHGSASARAPGAYRYDRLSSISGAATATYTHDYQGRRASKTVSGLTTTYLYDGVNLVGETTGGTTTNYAFGPGIDEPLIVNKAGTISYFNVDGLGSVTGTNNAAGTFDYNSVFDAWGSARSETGTRTNSFTYTGRETGEAGLHFYRARFLDPARGRFTQEDPLDMPMLSYSYVFNRPTGFHDPLGLAATTMGPGGACPEPPCPDQKRALVNAARHAIRKTLDLINDPKNLIETDPIGYLNHMWTWRHSYYNKVKELFNKYRNDKCPDPLPAPIENFLKMYETASPEPGGPIPEMPPRFKEIMIGNAPVTAESLEMLWLELLGALRH